MNPQDWQYHVVHAAASDKNSKVGAVAMIVVGLFFTPFMIGIPILIMGIYRLCK